MKDLKDSEINDIEADLVQIENTLCADEVEPPIFLDKQIIAASVREAERSSNTKQYRFSWWRKLSLPLYVATAFSFSVVAINSLWQAPEHFAEREFTADSSKNSKEITISLEESSEPSVKNERQLPSLVLPPESAGKTELEIVERAPLGTEQGSSQSDDALYTGNQQQKVDYPEQDVWARSIIELLKKGQVSDAKSELERFKQVYPNYPIDEQIKLFNR